MNEEISIGQGVSGDVLNNQSCCCMFQTVLFIFFVAGVIRIIKFIHSLISPFIYRRLDLFKRYGGGWAVVTGGSEGIGEGIALSLAKQNFNLILVSRSLQKLQKAKQNILKINPNISVQVYSVDFLKLNSQEDYRSAFKAILSKDVSILVNNVGMSYRAMFQTVQYWQVRSQMKLNLMPIAVLTKIFVQKFMKRQKRSGLINLSSGSTLFVLKEIAQYSATKIFDDYFSRAINEQIKEKVDVLTVRPFYVTTRMIHHSSSIIHTTTEQTGNAVVNALGNVDVCYGPFKHQLQGAILSALPQRLATMIANNKRSSPRNFPGSKKQE